MQPIAIEANRSKLIFALSASVVFVLLGILLIILPFINEDIDSFKKSFMIFGGVLAAAFFGFAGIYNLRRLSDRTPALVIDANGITDNTSGVGAGFIPWTDITNITPTAVMTTQMLIIQVKNPQLYIDRQTNWVKNKAMKANFNLHGSPITISNVSMKISFDQLNAAVMQGAQNYYNNVR